jgi:X-X-X-Leu-X-X-Gly heptad repeat protein
MQVFSAAIVSGAAELVSGAAELHQVKKPCETIVPLGWQ